MTGLGEASVDRGQARGNVMKGRAAKWWICGASALFATGVFIFGLLHLSPWAASWDEVDFVLALDRYDLLAMQPHAPGYPYLILGGRLMRLWPGIEGPKALSLWNLLLAASSAFPLYRLTRRWLGSLAAALAAALVLTLPMNAALSVRAMSEGAAIALLWWYLWAAVRAAERPTTARFLGAAFAFSLLMGTRLSYAPFGLALAWAWIAGTAAAGTNPAAADGADLKAADGTNQEAADGASGKKADRANRRKATRANRRKVDRANRRGGARLFRGLLWLVCAASFQLLWLAGMAAAEGGAGSMLALLESFALGHFDAWGGGAIADPMPPGLRLLRFVGDNVLWTGAFARSDLLLIAAALLLGSAIVAAGTAGPGAVPAGRAKLPQANDGFAGLGAVRSRLLRPKPGALLCAGAAAYALWALLGQNIAKPRHAAPIAALLLLGLAVLALRHLRRAPQIAARAALASAILLLAAQSAEAARLVELQASQRPAVYRLADYAAARMPARTVLYTWEEERVLNYLKKDIQTRPIYTYAYFLADLKASPDGRAWLTGAVLEGFRRQGAPTDHARLLAEFRSDERLDPVYGDLSLYEWMR